MKYRAFLGVWECGDVVSFEAENDEEALSRAFSLVEERRGNRGYGEYDLMELKSEEGKVWDPWMARN